MPSSTLVINEFDYDQPGTDDAEFIELKNIGTTAINLDGFDIVLINGNTGDTYRTIDLPNIELNVGEYYVISGSAANVVNTDLEAEISTNLIQNGTPDAIAIVSGSTIIDVVSYEGDTTDYVEGIGITSADSATIENVGFSRFFDGTDTDNNEVDFILQEITPGESNGSFPNLVINEFDYDQPGTDDAEFIELKNIGTTTINLNEIDLILINGATNSIYRTIDLPEVELAAGDYYVISGSAANVPNTDLETEVNTNLIQNDVDAIALVVGTEIVDTVSYEGEISNYTEGTGITSADSATIEDVGFSRFPDGIDTNENDIDFVLQGITPGEANLVLPTVTLSLSDSLVAENAGMTTITATLSETITETVTVELAFSGIANNGIDYFVSATSITITGGALTGETTLTAQEDSESEIDETVIVGIDAVTNGIEEGEQQVTVTLIDDDDPGISISEISNDTTEAGTNTSFTLFLDTQPSDDVILSFTSSDTTEGIVTDTLTFSPDNWNGEQTVIITGVDDNLVDGDIDYTITTTVESQDGNYNGISVDEIVISNLDNDDAGVTISRTTVEVIEGGISPTYTILLNRQPTESVILTVETGNQVEAIADLTFDETNWNIPQSLTITAVDDAVEEEIQNVTITHNVTSLDQSFDNITVDSIVVTVIDNDISEVEDDIPEVEDDISEVEDDIAEVEDDISEVEDDISEVEDDISEVEDDIAEVEDDISEVEDDIPEVEDDISEVEDDISEVEDNDNTVILTAIANNLFEIQGTSTDPVQLLVTLTNANAENVHEIGIFVVEDEQGTILDGNGNALLPGDTGYLEAALINAEIVLSVLGSDENISNINASRQLNFESNTKLQFYLVANNSTENILTDQGESTVLFSTDIITPIQINELNQNQFTIAWEDNPNGIDDFDNITLTLETSFLETPLGNTVQGQKELLDLRELTDNIPVNFTVESEAVLENSFGFYIVDNLTGSIGNLSPNNLEYAETAIQNQVNLSNDLPAGSLLAPFFIANGTSEEFLTQNPLNDAEESILAYFAYSSANPDGFDHIRLLGDNRFGVEDLLGGGDLDFNDLVVQVNFLL